MKESREGEIGEDNQGERVRTKIIHNKEVKKTQKMEEMIKLKSV